MTSRRSILAEMGIVTACILAVSHLLFRLRFITFIDEHLSVMVGIMLLYVPIVVMGKRGRGIDFIDISARRFASSVMVFLVSSLVVFPAFFALAHVWQTAILGLKGFETPPFPNLVAVIVYQLLIVALPEEFFFRGYVQSGLDAVFAPRWRILGVQLGWSWILTAAVFAIAHSFIVYRWWHFSIFFPALVFGYLRERTGSITAPVLFHAASNVLMNWFSRGYHL